MRTNLCVVKISRDDQICSNLLIMRRVGKVADADTLSEVLNILRDINPSLSKKLTKDVSVYSYNSIERKKMKCRILLENYRPVFNDIAGRIYVSSGEGDNHLGYNSDSLFTSIYHLV